jgi:hypothetical protein
VSTHRYKQIAAVTLYEIQTTVDPGASLGLLGGAPEVDVVLADDTQLSVLDEVMAQVGYQFVLSSPAAANVPNDGVMVPDYTGLATAPPVSVANHTRFYYDTVTGRFYRSTNGGPWVPADAACPIEIEVDFGTKPVTDAQFLIVEALSTATSKIRPVLGGKTATGRTQGDGQWDGIQFTAEAGVGSFILYAVCLTGSVVGKRVVYYTVDL